MKRGVSRISVSLPQKLLAEFGEAIQGIGYKDRSKAIRVAMRNLIKEYRWTGKEGAISIGAIMIIYDHEVRGIGGALTDIQHRYGGVINSMMHIHLNKRDCLEIIAVMGKKQRIEALSRTLMIRKGVKQVRMTYI